MALDTAQYVDRTAAPIGQSTYRRLGADANYRIVAREAVGDSGIEVVTAWLGTDHGPDPVPEHPLTFGSVALLPDGRGDLFEDVELFSSDEQQASGTIAICSHASGLL